MPLDPLLVRRAREEDMKEFNKHGVYVKVPLRECFERTGKKPIGVKWVDINKGDEEKPEYRSRLVAKEIKKKGQKGGFVCGDAAIRSIEDSSVVGPHGRDRVRKRQGRRGNEN